MRLDFNHKKIRVYVGDSDFEITDYLDGFALSAPDMDLGQKLTWGGTFEVCYNSKALRSGLTEADFSPYTHPERWRQDRKLTIEIYTATDTPTRIPLRIQSYAYRPQDSESPGIGSGNFYQLIDSVDKDRPAVVADEFEVGNNGNPIAAIVPRLLQLAFSGAAVAPPPPSAPGLWGVIDDKIVTRNPVSDAADVAATCWHWLTTRLDEGLTTINGNPLTHPILFARARGQYEITPELDGRGDWYSRAIVTGSYQKAGPPDEDCGEDQAPQDLDSQNRPKIIRSVSYATFAEVFPSSNGSSNTTTLESKVILYQYGNSLPQENLTSLWSQVSASMTVNGNVASYIPSIPATDEDAVVATMTIRQRPAGNIFEALGTATNLRIYEIEIESDRRKVKLRPWGLIKESEGSNFTLYPSPDEQLEATSASRPQTQPALTDPNDPTSKRCLEKRPEVEPQQPAPNYKMETVPVRGECTIAPTNWAPILGLPKIEDFGFLPSQNHASYNACQLAARLARLSDPWNVEIPVPDEWVVAGCPPYFRAHLHDAHYECEAIALIHDRERGTRMSFQANRIGPMPAVPQPLPPLPFIPVYLDDQGLPESQELQLSASIGAITGISKEAIGPFSISAFGGNP